MTTSTTNKPMFIGIDGPAAAGKTTAAKAVARLLGYLYVDTGAFYRAVAFWFDNDHHITGRWYKDGKPDMPAIEAQMNDGLPWDIEPRWTEDGTQEMYMNDQRIPEPFLRTPEISQLSSTISTLPVVRQYVNQKIKEVFAVHDVVMEGRDVCTALNPNADCKIFLTADRKVRAKRRLRDIEKQAKKGEKLPSLAEVEEELRIRDERDMNRKTDPLYKPADSFEIDNSFIGKDETVRYIMTAIRYRFKEAGYIPSQERR